MVCLWAAHVHIGCGPGNSTQVLVKRWPKARITGLDNSSAMIKKAKKDYPNQEWIIADAATYESGRKYDIIFSNAALQWIPDHENLLKRFQQMASAAGLVAIQIPLFWEMPLGKIINDTAGEDRWRQQMQGVSDLFTIHDHSFYYDRMTELFNSIEMWETQYLHILDSHSSILDMMRSTGLRPYLEKLNNDAQRNQFERQVLNKVEDAYPKQKDGKVLLPFKRLFLIGYKTDQKANCAEA